MGNNEINIALNFHEGTKHPGGFLMKPNHFYNYQMEPLKEKRYLDLPVISLRLKPRDTPKPAIEILGQEIKFDDIQTVLDLDTLTNILHFSAGITKTIRYPHWGQIPFRAAACTGALYHIEVYLVCAHIAGIQDGVYHLNPVSMALTQLRIGDFRAIVNQACTPDARLNKAQGFVIFTDMPARNAIKYQARAYRHTFWDSGTILANFMALTTSYELPTKLIMGFVDPEINELLGIDGSNEFAIGLLPLGNTDKQPIKNPIKPYNSDFQFEPVTHYRVDLQAIQAIHNASCLSDSEELAHWSLAPTERSPLQPAPEPFGEVIHLPEEYSPASQEGIENVIIRRGSTRQFDQKPITLDQLSRVLKNAYIDFQADFLNAEFAWSSTAYLLVNAVDGLENGSYVYHPASHSLEQLMHADVRRTAGFLALGQQLGADASVNIYFMANLMPVLERFGNRGYRIAQMDASIRAGRIYLTAYAQNFGASGLTFYDDEVTEFFSPHAINKSVMFLIAIGHREHIK